MKNLMLDALKTKLITSAMWTNEYANNEDINRNHTNYGATTAYAHVLYNFGVNVDIPVYEKNGFLKIPKITIDTKEIKLEF